MREIKFRAWYKGGMWWDVELISCAEVGRALIEVMQYTGLKDKNGREIYEGDIVTFDNRATLNEIVFDSGCFCVTKAIMNYEATYWGNEIEVVGNIYENPDLVKK